jgi:hypothetical protein
MTKKNLKAEVTVRVLGKDLTKAEAEELYMALGSALGKSPVIQYIYRDRYNPLPAQPYWSVNQGLIGLTSTSHNTATPDPHRVNYASSAMVEKIVN